MWVVVSVFYSRIYSIHVSNISSGSKSSFEFAEYFLSNESLRFRLVIVYRPPYSSNHPVTISTFLEEFAVYLESIILSSEPLCLTGDFNVHVDDPYDSSARCFRELLESMSLTQHGNVLTHDQGHTLDLVITRNSDSLICRAPFTDFPISDHLPVVCSLRVAKPPSSVSSVPVRKLRAIDPAAFERDIIESDLFLHPSDNLEELVLQFHDTLRALLDRHAPVKRKQIRARPSAPWMTDEIRYAKRKKRKAERRWRASKTPTNLALFRSQRNRVTYLMNKARQEYYRNFIDDISNDQRKLFKASKSLLNLAEGPTFPPCTDYQVLANEFGEFFVQKIAGIKSMISSTAHRSLSSTLPAELVTDASFSEFEILSANDVQAIILSSAKKSCLLDPFPTALLVEHLNELLPSITRMINLSLSTGHFPDSWKLAIVRPLFKKAGLEPVPKNYRPVSNLQYTSKLVETVVAKQLHKHLSSNNLLPVYQSAYRHHHSTETALLKVVNDILVNMDKQRVTLLLLLDLSAAFDTEDHGTLLRRLKNSFGIQGKVPSWFQSYLSGRSQCISVHSALSIRFNLDCGVPQGSCLGPLYSHSTPVDCFRLFRRICLTFIVLQTILNYIFPSVPMTLLMSFLP